MVLSGYEPKKVLEFFEMLSAVPRGSGNEEGISKFLEKFAKDRNLYCVRDEANNIIIKKPASKGYENSPAVILQGHMDMVCEKAAGVEHDFLKDPIKVKVENGFIRAEGTTLGADNGIAVAYCMALLDDDTIEHPPVEVVLTTDEETGMSGAKALNASLLEGRMLMNIDSEEEGQFLVSCCGGRRANIKIPVTRKAEPGFKTVSLFIGGLKGGHSGGEIHLQRANANKLMGRVLREAFNAADIRIISMAGGSVDNAITRDCCAFLAVKADDVQAVKDTAEKMAAILTDEYRNIEDKVVITVTENETTLLPVTKDDTLKLIRVINLIPYGVQAMCTDIEDLVETSSNLGIINTEEDCFTFSNSTRSSIESRKDMLCNIMADIAGIAGGSIVTYNDYPGWEFNPDSKLLKLFKETYVELYGKEPVVTAMHAGVECGLFAQKIPGIDMISFGPDMYDVHTPEERISIESIGSVWNYIKAVLRNMK